MKELLVAFLKYVNEVHVDSYGHLEVVFSEDEKTKKDYYSQTPEGIAEAFLAQNQTQHG